jgi:hypothetical protein
MSLYPQVASTMRASHECGSPTPATPTTELRRSTVGRHIHRIRAGTGKTRARSSRRG